ncbi:MAG: chromosome segregation protein SMC [Cyclobacteriaceae bacterium]|nr:chromosome segregation protein SMC [Cyclobacteriaceae bacterium]
MTENTEQSRPKNRKYWWGIIIAVIAVLLILQAVTLFFKFRADKEYNAEIEQARDEITILEHELTERKDEILSLGGNVNDLEEAVKQLEEEKENLIQNRKYSDTQLARLRNKVEGFQELLVMKDEEIAQLKFLNTELVEENIDLKTEKNELSATLSQEVQSRIVLEEKIQVAGHLKAENITIFAINSRGKVREEDEFKARFIDKIRVEFNIEENELAPIEGKDIMIRVVGPDENVLFDVASGSGTFMFNAKEEFYPAIQQILFDNTRQKLIFDYDKGSQWQPGTYELQIFTEDYMMGDKPFIVK